MLRTPGIGVVVALVCATWSAVVATSAGADAADSAAALELVYPNGLAFDRAGVLFVSDVGTHRILKLGRDQKLTVVAGTGSPGFGGDGGPAVEARLSFPADLSFDFDGNLLVADAFNHRIRRIDAKGVISTLVGDGKVHYAANNAPALNVSLNNPQGIAIGAQGDLYIADTYNHVIRRLDHDGSVSIYAGTEAGLAGDNGPATKAQLNLPQAVAVSPGGVVYISDGANSRIRRVRPDGIIETLVGFGPGSGEGGAGFGGDGGPAEKARLFTPADLKFNAAGNLYVSDSGNNRIRLLAHGAIMTIAGSGSPGFSGDEGKALQAALNAPQKIALAPDGSVYIADRVNRRVRKVDARGVMTTVVGGTAPAGVMVDPSVLTTPPGKSKP